MHLFVVYGDDSGGVVAFLSMSTEQQPLTPYSILNAPHSPSWIIAGRITNICPKYSIHQRWSKQIIDVHYIQ